jgi:hypothetical protein
MRGRLSDVALERIKESLPKASSLRGIGWLLPDSVALHFPPDSGMDIAVVCLRDAADYYQEAWLALHECRAAIEWYRVERDPPSPETAVFVGRFYADDVALRVYSAVEHLATFLQYYLRIPDDALKPYSRRRTSKASQLGHYLVEEMPGHAVTRAVLQFVNDENCSFTLDYRRKWVHDERPRIAGLGMVHRRQRRWRTRGKQRILGFGQGDQPDLDLDELAQRVSGALEALARLLDGLYSVFLVFLRDLDGLLEIRETDSGFEIVHRL